jgi:iron(III) transport system substrate-binding protein
MSTKKALRKRCGFRAAVTCALMVLAVLLAVPSTGMAAGEPKTVAEIALYRGPDREKMLIEGAKKEGKLMFYNSNTWISWIAQQFEKKYPFIKVLIWRSGSTKLLKRVMEEYAAERYTVDAIEVTEPVVMILRREGIFQEYYSPELRSYGDEVKAKGKTGVYYYADREIYIGLGFNTEVVNPTEAPKTYRDLLDPRWKGKMSIVTSATGIRALGNILDVMGQDFVKKLSRQDVKVQSMSGVAMANMVIAGEVPLSPTIFDFNIFNAKRKGAPVEWRPLEPVVANVGYSGVTTKAAHPHAAMLLLDYLHSKEGQKLVMKGGQSSPREDIGSVEQTFKKTYLADKYPLEEYEKKFNEWESLMKQLFIRR